GEPDWTRRLNSETISPAGSQIQRVVIDSGFTADRRIKALEYMPGDRRIVRAVFFSIQETGQWIGSWTPWYGYMSFPDGASLRIPAGAHIVADVHHAPSRQPVAESGTLGLFFADKPAASTMSNFLLETHAAGGDRFSAETRLTADTHAV